MSDDPRLSRFLAGETALLPGLFESQRAALRRMVQLRLDPRMRGRIDASDVLQEAFLDASRRADEYRADPRMPLRIWLRFLTAQRLMALQRLHLADKRDAGRQRSLQGGRPGAQSSTMALQLTSRLTSPSQAAIRAELQRRLESLLESLDPLDREILALRHFEELSNVEAAEILGIAPSAASKRFLRALERLQRQLADCPELLGVLLG